MEAAYPGIDRIIDGHYVRSFMVDGVCYHTRSGVLWRSLLGRVKENGCEQRHRNTYAGCSNNFEDFNSFAIWCNSQIGYMEQDVNGKFWSLDKDITLPLNKIYSEETCAFVPIELNSLVTYSSKTRGDNPLGVHFDKREGCYVAQGSANRTRKFLGYFECKMDAHKAYQAHKISKFAEAVEKYSGIVDIKVIKGLELHRNLFIVDLENNRETIR